MQNVHAEACLILFTTSLLSIPKKISHQFVRLSRFTLDSHTEPGSEIVMRQNAQRRILGLFIFPL